MEVYYFTILATMFTSVLAQAGWKNKIQAETNAKSQYNIFFVFLTGAILIFVAGFRWRVGTDYWQYSVNYSYYIASLGADIRSFNEPGINLIAKLASLIYDDSSTMFLIASIVTVGFSVRAIAKHSNMFAFSILLYIFIGAWHGSFNGIRQYLACAIIFAGHRHIIERNLKRFLLVVFLASSFHISATSMIILYFIPLKKLGFKQLLLMAGLSMAFLYSYDFVFRLLETNFAVNVRTPYALREVNSLRVAVQFAPLILYLVPPIKPNLQKNDMFYINTLILNAALSLATSGSAYLARFPIYTGVFATLGYPRLVNYKNRYLRALVVMIILMFYAIFWYYEVFGSSSLRNFQWVFSGTY